MHMEQTEFSGNYMIYGWSNRSLAATISGFRKRGSHENYSNPQLVWSKKILINSVHGRIFAFHGT